ncbi:hypothetical protein GCM10009582_11310 [Arthrobacter flavus]
MPAITPKSTDSIMGLTKNQSMRLGVSCITMPSHLKLSQRGP